MSRCVPGAPPTYLDLVPRICPTTRLDTPIPTICMEVARPMAVPRVAWGTTRGMDGHMLAWSHSRGVCSLHRRLPTNCFDLFKKKNITSSINVWTHGSERVGDSQPYGGDQRRDVGKGQEAKHRQREDGTGSSKNAPQTHIVLKTDITIRSH